MNSPAHESDLVIETGRFSRFHSITWWKQDLLRNARVLVIGAGAIGNELIKNLALLGIGELAIADMDRIEQSNLSRSVLFRPGDEGKPKADVASSRAREIYPDLSSHAICGNVLCDVGLGWFRWAQIVVGALDNREARVFVNKACAQVGRPWIDGGIDVLSGVVRGFAPPETACYECTMGQADWDQLAKRRSCSLLARHALAEGGTPTTPTTASVVGAIQAQEVVKFLHGLTSLRGRGFVFEGLTHSSYSVEYPISPDCPWHEPAPEVREVKELSSGSAWSAICDFARQQLDGLDAVDLSRELISTLECPACATSRQIWRGLDSITAEQAVCLSCGGECVPRLFHSVAPDADWLAERTPASIGLPPWDIIWARRGDQMLGLELSGDADSCLVRDG